MRLLPRSRNNLLDGRLLTVTSCKRGRPQMPSSMFFEANQALVPPYNILVVSKTSVPANLLQEVISHSHSTLGYQLFVSHRAGQAPSP